MAKGANQKLKLLYLLQILKEHTDEEHPIGMSEIIYRLGECGISAERKSVYDDIDSLTDNGYTVEKTGNKYYLSGRSFELPELKLLDDAIQTSKFITEKKSRELIKKLSSDASEYQRRSLSRQIYVAGRVKSMNESVYYSIDGIYKAIDANKMITFRYFDLDFDKNKKLRHDGKLYRVSPWALIWEDENYYLAAYDSERAMMRHYRVDKMQNINVSNTARDDALPSEDSVAEYEKRTFGMFGGKSARVELLCENSLAGAIFDRFGKDITVFKEDNGRFRVYVEVAVSPNFFSWVFCFGGGIKILSPEFVREEMRCLLEKVGEEY